MIGYSPFLAVACMHSGSGQDIYHSFYTRYVCDTLCDILIQMQPSKTAPGSHQSTHKYQLRQTTKQCIQRCHRLDHFNSLHQRFNQFLGRRFSNHGCFGVFVGSNLCHSGMGNHLSELTLSYVSHTCAASGSVCRRSPVFVRYWVSLSDKAA